MVPKRPPLIIIQPIFKSIVFLNKWVKVPEVEEANILFASLATATAGGIPIKIKKGVIKNPPPTPNKPDKNPMTALTKRINITLICTSAIGRYISIYKFARRFTMASVF